MREFVRVARVGTIVEQTRPAGLLPVVALVLGRHRDRVMRHGIQRSASVCPKLDRLDHRGPVAQPVHVLSCQNQADRALQRTRRQGGQQDLVLWTKTGTERTAHIRRENPHIVRFQVERAADIALNVLHALGLVVNRQLAVGSNNHRGGVKLHRIVMFDRHEIFTVMTHRGRRQCLVSVATWFGWRKRVIGLLFSRCHWHAFMPPPVYVGFVGFVFVRDLDQRRCEPGDFGFLR